MTPRDFAVALLRAIGAPQSANAVTSVIAWERLEGGHYHNAARYNPLNTSQGMPGSYNPGFAAGVQAYVSWSQGIEATAKTLLYPMYSDIVRALRAGASPADTMAFVNASPWGTKGTWSNAWLEALAGNYANEKDPHPEGGGLGGWIALGLIGAVVAYFVHPPFERAVKRVWRKTAHQANALLLAWVLKAGSDMRDEWGHGKAMPVPLAEAIAEVSERIPVFTGEWGELHTAAAFVVMGFRESTYDTKAIGDNGRSCGAFQTPCGQTKLGDARQQAELAARIMKRSAMLCPHAPLAVYAAGGCHGGENTSNIRMDRVWRLIIGRPFEKETNV